MNKPLKLFIVRKYIMAVSASDAIKKDRLTPPDDVWIDDEWKKNNLLDKDLTIGFK